MNAFDDDDDNVDEFDDIVGLITFKHICWQFANTLSYKIISLYIFSCILSNRTQFTQ